MITERPMRLPTLVAALVLLCCFAPAASASVDQYDAMLWGMKKVRAESAWSAGTGRGVIVAVVDSGVDPNHEDLKGNVVAGYDFVDDDADPSDGTGHGTHVSGIIAAVANNRIGVAGVAPGAKIMPVRVLDTDGSGSQVDIENGVRWAVEHGAKVVNLSLSADVLVEFLTGGTLSDAVDFAWSRGVIPVISAGNGALFRSELRGANAMVVTATTPDDRLAPYATGVGFAKWGIAAPGGTDQAGEKGMILSTFWEPTHKRRYAFQMGTSMAAPHVAGAAAILRGMGLSPQQTVERLLSTAKDLGPRGNDGDFGHGRLDVAAAAQAPRGSEGPPGEAGSSEAGTSATGRPGQNASGMRGTSGDVPVRRAPIATASPTPTPTAAVSRPTPTQQPERSASRRGPFFVALAAASGIATAALIAALLRRRAGAPGSASGEDQPK